MTLDVALCAIYIALAAAVLAAVSVKRVFYTSPLFFAYLLFQFAATAATLAVYQYANSATWYLRIFLFWLIGDCLLYFCALAEIGKNLLRINGKSRPHWSIAVMLFAAASGLVSVLSKWTAVPGRSPLSNLCFVGMRADSALEFAGFLALISWSNLRKLRWSNRELHIGTGFGFFTFAAFLISLLEYQWNSGPVYYGIYVAGQAADSILLAYWLRYFWIEDRGSLPRVKFAKTKREDKQTVSQ